MSQITSELQVVTKEDGVEIKLKLCNKGENNYFLSKRAQLNKKNKWLNTIKVTLDGESVDYTGIMVKMMAAEYPADYFELKPGDCKTSSTILNQYYDLGKPGEYEARYKFYNSNHETDELDIIRSEIIKFIVD